MNGSAIKNHKARGISQYCLVQPRMYVGTLNLWENLALESDNM